MDELLKLILTNAAQVAVGLLVAALPIAVGLAFKAGKKAAAKTENKWDDAFIAEVERLWKAKQQLDAKKGSK